MAMVVGDEVAALGVLLYDFVGIDEASMDLAKHNVTDGVVILFLEGEQGPAFEDGHHGLAVAFHLALAGGLQFGAEVMVFVHVLEG
jgi:hypothetical protein